MRETTKKFNTEETIKNIANLLEIELEEIPHYNIINNVFWATPKGAIGNVTNCSLE